jgi:hypothetical protein
VPETAPDPPGSGAFRASMAESIELPPHYTADRICGCGSSQMYWMIAKHNSIGGDRFRLGSIVPGEAGRESKVNSLMFLGNQ